MAKSDNYLLSVGKTGAFRITLGTFCLFLLGSAKTEKEEKYITSTQ